MPKWLRWLLLLGAVVVIALGVLAAVVWFSGGSGEPSGELVTPTITSAPSPATAAVTFEIDQPQSSVRFIIDEELRGAPKRVVGTTDQVAAQIIIDFDDPAASQLGTVRINARTLVTDSEFRDRAIRGQILDSASDEFEFIEFAPTAITGLPDSIVAGAPIALEVTGDLTIGAITRSVTFAVTLTANPDAVTGSGTATVERADFDLSIPSVPNVANVSEMVTLEIEFVAAPIG
jgi:polyisoprenoid-binding protein YceI